MKKPAQLPVLVFWRDINGTSHAWFAVSGLMGDTVPLRALCKAGRGKRCSELGEAGLEAIKCPECTKAAYAVTIALPHADALADQALRAARDAGITSFRALLRKVFG